MKFYYIINSIKNITLDMNNPEESMHPFKYCPQSDDLAAILLTALFSNPLRRAHTNLHPSK